VDDDGIRRALQALSAGVERDLDRPSGSPYSR
jgi:hypothetical protein